MRAIMVGPLFGLGELLDIFGGVLEGDELAAAGQRNRIIERPLLTLRRFHQRAARRGGFHSGACVRRDRSGDISQPSSPAKLVGGP